MNATSTKKIELRALIQTFETHKKVDGVSNVKKSKEREKMSWAPIQAPGMHTN